MGIVICQKIALRHRIIINEIQTLWKETGSAWSAEWPCYNGDKQRQDPARWLKKIVQGDSKDIYISHWMDRNRGTRKYFSFRWRVTEGWYKLQGLVKKFIHFRLFRKFHLVYIVSFNAMSTRYYTLMPMFFPANVVSLLFLQTFLECILWYTLGLAQWFLFYASNGCKTLPFHDIFQSRKHENFTWDHIWWIQWLVVTLLCYF